MVEIHPGVQRIQYRDAKFGDLLIVQLRDRSTVLGMKARDGSKEWFVLLSPPADAVPLPAIIPPRDIMGGGLKVEGRIAPDSRLEHVQFFLSGYNNRDRIGLTFPQDDTIYLGVATDPSGDDCTFLDMKSGVLAMQTVGDVGFSRWSILVADAAGDLATYFEFPAPTGRPRQRTQ